MYPNQLEALIRRAHDERSIAIKNFWGTLTRRLRGRITTPVYTATLGDGISVAVDPTPCH